jgi:uncharacterized membrane protein
MACGSFVSWLAGWLAGWLASFVKFREVDRIRRNAKDSLPVGLLVGWKVLVSLWMLALWCTILDFKNQSCVKYVR